MGQLLELKKAIGDAFDAKNIDRSDLDWIMVSVLNLSRSELNFDRDLRFVEIKKIYNLAKKRLKGIPLSQILGVVNFYGLDFEVNKNVLSPRPETELLVEDILKDYKSGRGLDVGTGSGAISVTLSKLGGLNMTAVDISAKALKVAKRNNEKNQTNVQFLKSDLFSKVRGEFDFIVSNPPYIKSDDIPFLDAEVKNHEPHLALDGGVSGLNFYEKIIKDAPNFLKPKGKLYFELGIGQGEDVKKLLETDFEDVQIIKDYANNNRIIKATKK